MICFAPNFLLDLNVNYNYKKNFATITNFMFSVKANFDMFYIIYIILLMFVSASMQFNFI